MLYPVIEWCGFQAHFVEKILNIWDYADTYPRLHTIMKQLTSAMQAHVKECPQLNPLANESKWMPARKLPKKEHSTLHSIAVEASASQRKYLDAVIGID